MPTDTKKPTPPTEDERMQACRSEIMESLRKHRCQILPVLSYELVGNTGSKVMLAADYVIAPERE